MALQRSFFDRVRAERPDLLLSSSVGCQESDDVRVEVDIYNTASDEDEAAVRRMAAEYGDRIVVTRRLTGPPMPAVGILPAPPGRPPAPRPPTAQIVRPLPRFAEAMVVRRGCGRQPVARIALASKWRSRVRGFRVGARPLRRTVIVVPLRRTVRVGVVMADGRRVVGRIARCA